MKDTEHLLTLLACVAAGFFLGMGYANKQRALQDAATGDLGDGGSMAWLTSYGGGWR